MTSAVPKVTNAKKATTSQSRFESLSMLHPLSRINYAAAAFHTDRNPIPCVKLRAENPARHFVRLKTTSNFCFMTTWS